MDNESRQSLQMIPLPQILKMTVGKIVKEKPFLLSSFTPCSDFNAPKHLLKRTFPVFVWRYASLKVIYS